MELASNCDIKNKLVVKELCIASHRICYGRGLFNKRRTRYHIASCRTIRSQTPGECRGTEAPRTSRESNLPAGIGLRIHR